MMELRYIDRDDPTLKDVIELGTRNAKTLGFFPEGAFIDHARKRNILVATKNGKLLGYLLFRITQSKRVISITHLCIEESSRNQGVAKKLLDELKGKYQNLLKGMQLNCREDYEIASQFWDKYGFKAIKRKRSRSKEENYLWTWWYDFGNDDLFSANYKNVRGVKALLDACVLIKMREDPSLDDSGIHTLKADWLIDEVEFYFAQETYNEIKRDKNRVRAEETRKFIRNFREARFDPDERDSLVRDLKSVIKGENKNDRSDRRQLAECITSDISYFITTDRGILDMSEEIFEIYSTRVFHPSDFILFIDQITNSSNYHSYRVAGAKHEYNNISYLEVDDLVERFQKNSRSERKHRLRDTLTKVAANVESSIFKLVKDDAGNCLGFYAAEKESNSLIVKTIRSGSHSFSGVLYKQLLQDIIHSALEEDLKVIRVEEPFLSDSQKAILESSGFKTTDQEWIKVVIRGLTSIEEIFEKNEVQKYWNPEKLYQKLNDLEGIEKTLFKFKLEKKFWPGKIKDIEIPTYIIPIKPYWAGQLFDYNLSNTKLFGSDPKISWNSENVYYRSVNPVSEQSPARILWYLSSAANKYEHRQKGVAACSYLDEVHTGPAKKLYGEFKNFGIYKWKDIYKMTNNNAEKEIKVLKFSDTEVFKKIVPLNKINEVLEKNNRAKNSFASPLEVSNEIFNQIYFEGKFN